MESLVPEQMSVISFNNAIAELTYPALTTIDLNIFLWDMRLLEA